MCVCVSIHMHIFVWGRGILLHWENRQGYPMSWFSILHLMSLRNSLSLNQKPNWKIASPCDPSLFKQALRPHRLRLLLEFYIDAGDSNSDSHACTARALTQWIINSAAQVPFLKLIIPDACFTNTRSKHRKGDLIK